MRTKPHHLGRTVRAVRVAFAVLLAAHLALGAEDSSLTSSQSTPTTVSKADDFGPSEAAQIRQRWRLAGLIVVLLGIGAFYRHRKNPFTPDHHSG